MNQAKPKPSVNPDIDPHTARAAQTAERELRAGTPCLWTNPLLADVPPARVSAGDRIISLADVHAARARFDRFAPLLARLFPETAPSGGTIESPLLAAPTLQQMLGLDARHGRLWIKGDHALPIAGSIKARGGIHEVLEFAEKVALEAGLIQQGDDYARLAEADARDRFSRYQVAVGSTGNLGLSIGVMASALGFRAAVHMSADAKAWKKARLRARGVEVVEHAGDYAQAVAAGRQQAASDPYCHFVDDERSLSLMLGYSAAALHLDTQLAAQGLRPDAHRPLFVYLPCGVGGAPAGIAFGLKQLYGEHVHCFFAEPTASPCFLVQMLGAELGGQGGNPSVYDYGLDNRTEADGLAVPRASELAAGAMRELLSGVYTVADDTLFRHLFQAQAAEGIQVEPSAAAGFSGPAMLTQSEAGRDYLERRGLTQHMPQAIHLAWTTGGLFVPDTEYRNFLDRGAALLAA